MCGPKLYEYTCGATEKGDETSFVTCNLAPPICKKHVLQRWKIAGRCGDCVTCKIIEKGGGIGSSHGSGGYDRTSGKKHKSRSGHQYDANISDERLEAADSIEKRRGDERKIPSKRKPTSRETALQSQPWSNSRQIEPSKHTNVVLNDKGEHENCTCADCEGSCMLLSYVRCKNNNNKRSMRQNCVHEHGHPLSILVSEIDRDQDKFGFGDELNEYEEETARIGFIQIDNNEFEGEDGEEHDSNTDDDFYHDYDHDIDDPCQSECDESDNDDGNHGHDDQCNKQKEQPRPFKCKGRPISRHYEIIFHAISHRGPEDIQKDVLSSIDDFFDEVNYNDWTREVREMFRDNRANFDTQVEWLEALNALLKSHNYKAHEFTSVDTDISESIKRRTWIDRLQKDLAAENKENIKSERRSKKNGDKSKENKSRK